MKSNLHYCRYCPPSRRSEENSLKNPHQEGHFAPREKKEELEKQAGDR